LEEVPDILPPRVSRLKPALGFLLRTLLFAALAYAVFGWLFVPVPVRSTDMMPTYKPGGMTFCFRPAVWFGKPDRGDVVFVPVPGSRRLILLRVVAVAGDSVGFAGGRLVVNGRFLNEPYVASSCNWTLPPVAVREKAVFVVGDDRSAPMNSIPFGQVDVSAIAGAAVW
jgi:signal peptidase I